MNEEVEVEESSPHNHSSFGESGRLLTPAPEGAGVYTPPNDGGMTATLQHMSEAYPVVPPKTGPPTPATISSSRPYTPTNEIGFTPARAQEMVAWATPRHNDNLRIKQEQTIDEILTALGEKCPFPVAEIFQIGAGRSDTMVRKYEEQLEVIAVVSGLSSAGCVDYRAPFIDFLLEYLR